AAKPGLAYDAGREPVVRLHEELQPIAEQHTPERRGAAQGRFEWSFRVGAHDCNSNCGSTSRVARSTSAGKSISIQGVPVRSQISKDWLRSSNRSRTASSCGRCARELST